jgi:tRNA(adenine34) deaminase
MTEVNVPSQCDEAADAAYMRLAIEQGRIAASIGEVPIGAVVVCDGQVVAAGYNRREIDADPSAHAEFRALIEASKRLGRWRLTGCTVYVTLEPCLMCAGLMQLSRVDRCVFGAPDPKGGALGTLYELHSDERLNHRFEATAGVCEQECSALLSQFFAQLRVEKNQSRAGEPHHRANKSQSRTGEVSSGPGKAQQDVSNSSPRAGRKGEGGAS